MDDIKLQLAVDLTSLGYPVKEILKGDEELTVILHDGTKRFTVEFLETLEYPDLLTKIINAIQS